jgi:hypothetical protein
MRLQLRQLDKLIWQLQLWVTFFRAFQHNVPCVLIPGDVKTRWSSTNIMINRVLQLKDENDRWISAIKDNDPALAAYTFSTEE